MDVFILYIICSFFFHFTTTFSVDRMNYNFRKKYSDTFDPGNKTCIYYKAGNWGSECRCRSWSPTFYSTTNGNLRCVSRSIIGCDEIKWNLQPSQSNFKVNNDCANVTIKSVSIWNIRENSTRKIIAGSWDELPQYGLIAFNVTNYYHNQHYDIEFNFKGMSRSMVKGQLIKINLGCDKCFVFGYRGERDYPIDIDALFDHLTTPTTATTTTTTTNNTILSCSLKKIDRNDNVLLISALIGTSFFLLMIVLIVFIYCKRKKSKEAKGSVKYHSNKSADPTSKEIDVQDISKSSYLQNILTNQNSNDTYEYADNAFARQSVASTCDLITNDTLTQAEMYMSVDNPNYASLSPIKENTYETTTSAENNYTAVQSSPQENYQPINTNTRLSHNGNVVVNPKCNGENNYYHVLDSENENGKTRSEALGQSENQSQDNFYHMLDKEQDESQAPK